MSDAFNFAQFLLDNDVDAGETIVYHIPWNLIAPQPGFNPRQHFNPARLEDLKADIWENQSVHTPITCRPSKGADKDTVPLWIVCGERRWRAVKSLCTEDETSGDTPIKIPVVINRMLNDEDALLMALSENDSREALTLMEVAFAVRRLVNGGMPDRTIYSRFGRDQEWLNRMVEFCTLPTKVQTLINESRMTFESALLLSQKVPYDQLADVGESLVNAAEEGAEQEGKTKNVARSRVTKAAKQLAGKIAKPGKREIMRLIKNTESVTLDGRASMKLREVKSMMVSLLQWAAGDISEKDFREQMDDFEHAVFDFEALDSVMEERRKPKKDKAQTTTKKAKTRKGVWDDDDDEIVQATARIPNKPRIPKKGKKQTKTQEATVTKRRKKSARKVAR